MQSPRSIAGARLASARQNQATTMAPADLLDQLCAFFPEFRTRWNDPGNCFRDQDGSFTLHGVFAEFSGFFHQHHAALPPDRITALGAFLSECMDSSDEDLNNAAGTCFVENIAGEPCDRELSRHLTGEARRYWRYWGGTEA
jgi:hypothetical protein